MHACALAVLTALPRTAISTDVPDERSLLVAQITIERRLPPAAAPQRRVAAHPAASAVIPTLHAAKAVEHTGRPLVVSAEARYRAPERPQAQTSARSRRQVALTLVAPTPHPDRTEAVASLPAAAPPSAPAAPVPAATAAVVAQRDEGLGNFGETYAASVDPQVRGTLFSGIGAGFVVRVSVDESGRAVAVDIVRGPDDGALREQIRSRILALRFIPAQCNGIHCAGTVELRS